ncbi:hypothetical protein PRUPE_7G167500 [Prunus persica]|uniref:Uncharacterized protein n=1 Tax=Prunus persica TaxID=3760 RepID=M5WCT9_PRUPE|nr:uncharacterized protein LOC18769404 [Prunus persica]ONH97061.1 hypothetical protein PRUPE_7G167500 [Prunus persica]
MEAKLLHFLASTPSSPTHLVLSKPTGTGHNHIFSGFSPTRPGCLRISTPIYNSTGSDGGNTSSPETDSNSVPPPLAPDNTGLRFRKRSRRRTKLQREEGSDGDGGRFTKAQAITKPAAAPKKWEDMSLGEKALELYVGEKGLLFWINKFAYASIYIVIGAWLCFRFVGPALNLYQLDAPPLSPTSILKGS